MGLRINSNLPAMAATRALAKTSEGQSKSYQRISSGERITSAGDDAAGLAISESLRAQVRSMGQAERNTNDGLSFAQVAEGGLTEVGDIMIRLRELAIQAASDTVGDRERGYINQESQSLIKEVDRIANVTQFNGTQLLNGQGKDLSIQVGIHNTADDRIVFQASDNDVRASTLGVDGVAMDNIDSARDSLDKIDSAMGSIFAARARLGAAQNKLGLTANSIAETRENMENARSRIADTDIAEETTNMVKGNILQSAGIAVLAQANAVPSQVLKLLG